MNTPPSILDYSRYADTPFYAYTTEQMITTVRTRTEQIWSTSRVGHPYSLRITQGVYVNTGLMHRCQPRLVL